MSGAVADRGSISERSSQAQVHPKSETLPALTVLFRIVAALEMVGGVSLCAELWPGNPEPGYTWKTVAYVPALTWLIAGFVFGLLFWAIGDGLLYLRDIRAYLCKAEPHLQATPRAEG